MTTLKFFRLDITVVCYSMMNGKIYFSLTQLYYTNNLREHGCPDYTNSYNPTYDIYFVYFSFIFLHFILSYILLTSLENKISSL